MCTLEQSLIAAAPSGVSVVRDLPGGWLAIVAKREDGGRSMVDYLKHPDDTLMAAAMAVAERWIAQQAR